MRQVARGNVVCCFLSHVNSLSLSLLPLPSYFSLVERASFSRFYPSDIIEGSYLVVVVEEGKEERCVGASIECQLLKISQYRAIQHVPYSSHITILWVHTPV